MTCEQSIALSLASIFSSGGSPVAEQARPATERAWEIQRLRSGGRWPESSASYDPDSSCWRTSQTSLLSSEGQRGERFSGTWPRSGMSLLGTVYPLPPLAPRTSATGSSLLLPSPMARTNSGAEVTGRERTGGPMLGEALADLLPTPMSHELLPTPTATPYGNNQSPSKGAAVRPSLESLAAGAAMAQQSPDGKKSPAPLLNPCFVEWMLGLPAGWSDPDCPLSATEFRSKQASSLGSD